tara:strand:+ start:311 stop:2074 length:1764 start_codon:yes stop_codon:yes gene_type:complete
MKRMKKLSNPHIYLFLFFGFSLFFSTVSYTFGAEKLKVLGKIINDPQAKCNSGSQASFYQSNDEIGKKVFIYFPGGDVARTEADFIQRKSKLKKSLLIDSNKKSLSLEGGFKEINDAGYSIIYVPYCSSDIFMGDHEHQIKDEEVPFKGKKIVEAIEKQLRPDLENANEIVLAGTSAGSIAISANLQIFTKRYKSARIRTLHDSFWLDSQERKAREKFDTNKFIHKTIPFDCLNPLDCFPQTERLSKFGIDDSFIIFNMGDMYRFGRKDEDTQKELAGTFKIFGGGISIGKGYNLKGVKGDHGVLGAKAFHQKIDKDPLGKYIINWLKDENPTILIKPNKVLNAQGIEKRLNVIKDPLKDSPTIIISGDSDCDGHSNLQKKLQQWKYNWVYVDHCLDRLRKGFGINRIKYTDEVTVALRVFDIMKTVEWLTEKNWFNQKIVVTGFAQGGSAVNAVVDKASLERAASIYSFPFELANYIKGGVSYYPFCQIQRVSKRPAIPHLVQVAGKDRFDDGFSGCGEKISRSSSFLEIAVYPDAQHGFDRSKYKDNGKRSGRTKVGSQYLIEYSSNAEEKSLKKLKSFLSKTLN